MKLERGKLSKESWILVFSLRILLTPRTNADLVWAGNKLGDFPFKTPFGR
jgi:hypothetical protein